MRALHLFAGAGGSVLAGRMLGWTSVGCVEIDPFCCAVLEERGEHVLGRDVTTFSGVPHAGAVDVVVGGSPCQDLSVAGKRAGLGGERSSLWHHQLRIAVECEAPFIFWENVRGALSSNAGRDFGVILRGLADAGYDARWGVFRASDVGAPHRRERVFLVADGARQRVEGYRPAGQHQQPVPAGEGLPGCDGAGRGEQDSPHQLRPEPGLGGAVDGVANGMDWPAAGNLWPQGRGPTQHTWEAPRLCPPKHPQRIHRLKALGNGWVPAQAVLAWRMLCRVIPGL